MSDSKITKDRVNHWLIIIFCSSAFSTNSISKVVLIDVGEFCFTSILIAHHPIHPNQISGKRVQATHHKLNAINELQLFLNLLCPTKRVCYFSGTLSRIFDISQGTGQGRILAPFMYKIYINSLLEELSSHSYAVFINSIKLTSPTFADDISLIALQPSFLQTFLKICFQYSLKWRYEFNNSKSGVVTFGETKSTHSNQCKIVNGSWVKALLMNFMSTKIWGHKKLRWLILIQC